MYWLTKPKSPRLERKTSTDVIKCNCVTTDQGPEMFSDQARGKELDKHVDVATKSEIKDLVSAVLCILGE